MFSIMFFFHRFDCALFLTGNMQQNGNCYSIFKKISFCALMKRAADPLETGCSFFLSEACLFCAVILRTAEAQNRQTDGSEEEGEHAEAGALAEGLGQGDVQLHFYRNE